MSERAPSFDKSQTYTVIDENVKNIEITLEPHIINDRHYSHQGEINMNFKVSLDDLNTSEERPLSFTLDSVRSIKEEKIKLTAPLFCKPSPAISGLTVLNTTQLVGPITIDDQGGRPNFVLLEDLLIYLIPDSPNFHLL
jgi:hypothetical protein